jgi:apolipoprotein N-acyltransferase
MKRATCLCLCLCIAILSLTACQRAVTIPAPTDPTAAVTAIVQSNIPETQKQITLRELLDHMERQYRAELERADRTGTNVRDVIYQVIAVISSIVGLTLAATK